MIYGDMLAFFPEAFRRFEYFLMNPNTVASYSKREYVKAIVGVLQYVKNSELKRENYTLDDVSIPTLWTREILSIQHGFVQIDDTVFRLVKKASWKYDGGFSIYVLEEFVGNSDVQTPFEYVDLGQNSYD